MKVKDFSALKSYYIGLTLGVEKLGCKNLTQWNINENDLFCLEEFSKFSPRQITYKRKITQNDQVKVLFQI